MFPATTRSPPKCFTPRYWGLLVRPLRLEPTPFLCAMVASAQRQVGDADLGVALPMPGLATVVLPPLELEHVDLGLLALPHHLGLDLGAGHQRRAGPDGVTIRREQHLVEGDLGACRGLHQGETQRLALLRPELLSGGSKNRVHEESMD